MENEDILAMVAVLFMITLIGSIFVLVYTIQNYEQEAFDRGFMVQCIGKTGYYWECEG
jgi:uncharacterized membrane protein